jgi:hypothetical protein
MGECNNVRDKDFGTLTKINGERVDLSDWFTERNAKTEEKLQFNLTVFERVHVKYYMLRYKLAKLLHETKGRVKK